MTLYQMSFVYRDDAARLRARIRALRTAKSECGDVLRVRELERRIAELSVILRQSNELASLTEHYYDRGYHRSEKYTL
ncbi:MAG: hypothetical protein IJF15_06395 [Oscillospiraceae bacterium]|nr:hypothetical protein [Oscillospiraceae bacterium]